MAELKASVILQMVDRISRPISRIQRSFQRLGQSAGLQRLHKATAAVGQGFSNVLSQGQALTRRIALIGGAAVGLGWSLNRLVQGFTEPADAAIKMSRAVSLTHEEVQLLLGAVGRMTRMSTGEFSQNMVRFERRLSEAARGAGVAADVYEHFDIATRDANGNLRSSMDVMRDVADLLSGISDEALRGEIAYRLYGDRSGQMVNLLQEGSAALEEQMRIFKRTGQVVDEQAGKAAEEYNDNLGELTGTIRGLRNIVVIELLPALNRWILRASEVVQQNRELITKRILGGMDSFWRRLKEVGSALEWTAGLLGGWGGLAALVAAVMAGPLILSTVLLIGSILKFGWVLGAFVLQLTGASTALAALGTAMLAMPITWIIAAIAAVAAAVFLLYRHWDSIAAFFQERFAAVRQAFSQDLVLGVLTALRDFNPVLIITDAVNDIIEYLTGVNMADVGGKFIGGLWNGITESWQAMTKWLETRINALVDWMPDWVKERLGLDGMAATPQLGGNVLREGEASGAGLGETRVGGELRISIDSEGRPSVQEMRRDGPMDLDVDVGMTVMP